MFSLVKNQKFITMEDVLMFALKEHSQLDLEMLVTLIVTPKTTVFVVIVIQLVKLVRDILKKIVLPVLLRIFSQLMENV